MDIHGMALYEQEIVGVSLLEARKKPRTRISKRRLDLCRSLVGQDTVPDFSAVTSPTKKTSFSDQHFGTWAATWRAHQ